MIKEVQISKSAKKFLLKVPKYIKDKFFRWMELVKDQGLEEARKIKGYHDEPLKGDRTGERSIRLSRSYRVIYIIIEEEIKYCEIKEIHKHDY